MAAWAWRDGNALKLPRAPAVMTAALPLRTWRRAGSKIGIERLLRGWMVERHELPAVTAQ
ncbi:hypothetical protein [Xanthomonas oryzae]|uniref:hypothetical protein n=1 Tax=Xanthomonas oryzae TaxID=347 RepID=UPI000AA2183B|nr:hypothetical protein [Xanthomonas oryzae]